MGKQDTAAGEPKRIRQMMMSIPRNPSKYAKGIKINGIMTTLIVEATKAWRRLTSSLLKLILPPKVSSERGSVISPSISIGELMNSGSCTFKRERMIAKVVEINTGLV